MVSTITSCTFEQIVCAVKGDIQSQLITTNPHTREPRNDRDTFNASLESFRSRLTTGAEDLEEAVIDVHLEGPTQE